MKIKKRHVITGMLLLPALAIASCGKSSGGNDSNKNAPEFEIVLTSLNNQLATCGEREFMVYPGTMVYTATQRELKNGGVVYESIPLTPADTANGVSFKAFIQINADMYRDRSIRKRSGKLVLGSWEEWQDGSSGVPALGSCYGGYMGENARPCNVYFARIVDGSIEWAKDQFLSHPTKFDCELLTRE